MRHESTPRFGREFSGLISLSNVQEHAIALEGASSIPSTEAARVEVARSFGDLAGLRGFWKGSTGHRDSDFDVFRSLMFCRPDIIEPYVLTAYRHGQPEALVAGRIVEAQLRFKVGYLNLFRTKIRTLNIPCGGLRGCESDENCHLFLEAILRALGSGEFDRVDFEPVKVGSRLYRVAKQYSSRFSCERQVIHRYLELPDNTQGLYQKSSGLRRRRNQALNRFKTDHGREPSFREFARANEIPELLGLAEQIARSTYQRALQVGFAAGDEQTRELLRLAAEKGWLRAFVVFDQQSPMAFLTCTLYEGTAYLDFIGFHPDYARYSPGLLLLLHAFEVFCREGGVRIVDFGRGDASYKQELSTIACSEAPMCFFRPTLGGRSLEFLWAATMAADNLFKRILERVGVLKSLKKAWRMRVSGSCQEAARVSPTRS